MELASSCFDSSEMISSLVLSQVAPEFKGIHISFAGRYGLSNRVRALAGYSAAAILMGMRLDFDWSSDASCPGGFFEVFEHSWFSNKRTDDIDAPFSVGPQTHPLHCGATPTLVFSGFSIAEVYQESFNHLVKEFYRRLLPVRRVVERCESVGLSSTDKVLGVHIRRTDMIDHCIKRGLELPSDDHMHREVHKYLDVNDDAKIFVCSDNPQSLADFRSSYGDRVRSFANQWDIENFGAALDASKQHRLTSLLESVADLYLLSQADFIIGTKHSSFSSFASLWGGVPLIRV